MEGDPYSLSLFSVPYKFSASDPHRNAQGIAEDNSGQVQTSRSPVDFRSDEEMLAVAVEGLLVIRDDEVRKHIHNCDM